MNFQQYLNEEIKGCKPINETVVQAGKTDVFKGNEYCGKHHHQYILWYPAKGWGETGNALEDPVSGNAPVVGHIHMIVDGKVLEANGHTHELLKPDMEGPDTSISDIELDVRRK